MYFCAAWYSAEYICFVLEDQFNNYKIHIGGYSGDKGNAMEVTDYDEYYDQNGMSFSTYDHDNDNLQNGNCAYCMGEDGGTISARMQTLTVIMALTSIGHRSSAGPVMYLNISRMMIKPLR